METTKKTTTKKATTKKATTKKSVTQKAEKVDEVNSALAEENAMLKKQLEEIKVKESSENEELKKQLDDMMKNYKNMQLQLQNVLLTQKNQNEQAKQDNTGSAVVGCLIFNGATLVSQGGDIIIPIEYKQEVDVEYTELREVFKNPFGYRSLFRKGILYFVNPEDYKRFNIKQEIDLSDEALINLLSHSSPFTITDKMKQMTREKKDLTEMFAIIYQIANLIDKKKVDLDYEIRSALEKYFEVDFKTLINNLHQ